MIPMKNKPDAWIEVMLLNVMIVAVHAFMYYTIVQ